MGLGLALRAIGSGAKQVGLGEFIEAGIKLVPPVGLSVGLAQGASWVFPAFWGWVGLLGVHHVGVRAIRWRAARNAQEIEGSLGAALAAMGALVATIQHDMDAA